MIIPQVNVQLNQQDLERLRKALRTEANRFSKTFDGSSQELAKTARAYARSIAPRDRGYAIRSIQWRTTKTDQAEIWISQTILNENPTNIHNFNYVRHMHEANGAMGRGVHITSGDPRFMFTTRDYMKRVMKEKIQTYLGKTNK